MPKLIIPFKPREYQKPLIDFVLDGGKRAIVLWHRRAGKDVALWNLMIRMALKKKGLYYYFLPTYTQGKKILWDGITNDGLSFRKFIPDELVKSSNSTEMKIVLVNGAVIQIIGTDTYDSIRGTNPVGCVFSEYAFQNPMAWEVVKPILKINGGWAIFNTTPNGKNHAYDLSMMAKGNADWFFQRLTIDDTKLLNDFDMEEERREGMSEEMIQQEYYCSFEVGAVGSYYAKQIQELQDRVCALPAEKNYPVDVWMDIGKSDGNSVGFVQRIGKQINFLDFFESNGNEVDDDIALIKARGYEIGTVWLPHDAFAKRKESSQTIAQQYAKHFAVKRVPMTSIQNGIQQVRKFFKYFWFDKEKTGQLLRCLECYRKDYDQRAKVFKPYPVHDWASHASDMVRYVCVTLALDWEKVPEDDEAMKRYLKGLPPVINKNDPLEELRLQAYAKRQSNPFSVED